MEEAYNVVVHGVWRTFAVFSLMVTACASLASGQSDAVLEKAERVFGQSLNPGHHVFAVDDTYVAWLILNTNGDLFEVDVGPRFFYTDEFPNSKAPDQPRYISESEYETLLLRISSLKETGQLQSRQSIATRSQIINGWITADRFDKAFVEKIVAEQQGRNGSPEITRFNVHFLQSTEGSPTEIDTADGQQPQVCLGSDWYYVLPEESQKLTLGRWQHFLAAGPNLNGRACVRTVTRYDADGFTIEEPQNELIVIAKPYTVRALRGRVRLGDTPLEGVCVELRRIHEQKVLRATTNADGMFGFPAVAEGEYKFKLTKDGFKAITGKIVVDKKSRRNDELSFDLPVGT